MITKILFYIAVVMSFFATMGVVIDELELLPKQEIQYHE